MVLRKWYTTSDYVAATHIISSWRSGIGRCGSQGRDAEPTQVCISLVGSQLYA